MFKLSKYESNSY